MKKSTTTPPSIRPRAETPTIAPPIARILACLFTLILLAACEIQPDEDTDDDATPAEPADPQSAEIQAFTGAPTKIVWMRYTKTDTSDVYGNFSQFQLWGIDTTDNLGARPIIEKKGNYSRPLITPDGKSIVFTRKNTERNGSKKAFKPEIFRIDWNGKNLERLSEGYAVDLWRDPDSKINWVYTANLTPTDQSNLYADKIERFQLIDPIDRELVFDDSKISPDNIQLSRDGKRMSCLFPWPNVGVVDLETGQRWQNQHGCWPSMAPDNSYAAWVFDGAHKSVHLFADRGKKHAQVSFGKAPGIGGHEMYHPRWSNHVRYLIATGPYTGRTIGDGGHSAEILLGKFSADLKTIDDWLQITDNDFGDFFPDVWVENGDSSVLDPSIFQGDSSAPETNSSEGSEWPSDTKNMLFVWESGAPEGRRMVPAREDDRGHESSVTAHGRARFGRHFQMLADAGYFTIDAESTLLIDDRLDGSEKKRSGGFAFEAWVTSAGIGDGIIFSHPKFQLRQNEGEFRFAARAPRPATMSLGPVVPGESVHLALSMDDEGWWIYRDGRGRTDEKAVLSAEPMASRPGTVIGGEWNGHVEGIAIYDRSLSAEEIAANHQHWKNVETQRADEVEANTVPTYRLKAKLLEKTTIRSVDELAYSRALICNRYEVLEMTEGSLEEKEIAVYHWAVMDRKALRGFPDNIGLTYDLTLQNYDDHPEVVSELRWSDFFEEGFPLYYDITPPGDFIEQ